MQNKALNKEQLEKKYNIVDITLDETNQWHVWTRGYPNGYTTRYDIYGQIHEKILIELPIIDSISHCKHKEDRVYKTVVVRYRGYLKYLSLARVLYAYFIGDIPEGMQIDHKDNNSLNNSLENLQLLTPSENLKKRSQDDPAVWCNGCGPAKHSGQKEKNGTKEDLNEFT